MQRSPSLRCGRSYQGICRPSHPQLQECLMVCTQASRPSGSRVTRSGKHSVELLVKNQFLWCYINGTPLTKVLLQEPMPLDHGKSCPAQLEACRKDWKSLRQHGHAGPAIEHYCFDRFGISGHERLWRQWHAMVAGSFQDSWLSTPQLISANCLSLY